MDWMGVTSVAVIAFDNRLSTTARSSDLMVRPYDRAG